MFCVSWCADFEFRGTSGLSDADCAERRRGIPAGPERVVAVDAGEMHCLSLSPAPRPNTQSSAIEKGESQDGETQRERTAPRDPAQILKNREQLGCERPFGAVALSAGAAAGRGVFVRRELPAGDHQPAGALGRRVGPLTRRAASQGGERCVVA